MDETIQQEEEEAEAEEAEVEAEEEEEEDDVPITVALIKPDAVADGKIPEILEKLEECGIDVLSQVERVLTREDAETFYEEHRGTDFFLQLIDYMTRYASPKGSRVRWDRLKSSSAPLSLQSDGEIEGYSE